jgi:hypothetical protein
MPFGTITSFAACEIHACFAVMRCLDEISRFLTADFSF